MLRRVSIPLQFFFDVFNTVVPFLDPNRLSELRKISRMKKMSTIAIGAIINECVREMPRDACYLNIGTWYGYSLFAGMVGNASRRCIGIDSFEQFGHPKVECLRRFEELRSDRHEFHVSDWRQYMAKHASEVGVFFYDADHSEDCQYESLLSCHPFIVDGGIVIVDDANWTGPRRATERFLRLHSEYEVLLDVATYCNCHPTFWNGLMILRKKPAHVPVHSSHAYRP